MGERKVAFFVAAWSSDPTLFAWTWLKQNFLRKQPTEGSINGFVLSERDVLYVVHVQRGDDDDAWMAGGPVQPDLTTALAKYPHKTVVLEASSTASAHALMAEWVEQTSPDILVFGIREKGKPHKVVEYFRQHSTVPFLIVQPENVRNDRLRLNSDRDSSDAEQSMSGSRGANGKNCSPRQHPHGSSPPKALATVEEVSDEEDLISEAGILFEADAPLEAPLHGLTRPRKIAIAYERLSTGRLLLTYAAKTLLQPQDSLLLVHCIPGKRDGHRDGSADSHMQHTSKTNGVHGIDSAAGRGEAPGVAGLMPVSPRDLASGCMPKHSGVPSMKAATAGVAGALERITTRRRHRGEETLHDIGADAELPEDLLQGINVVHSVRVRGDPKVALCRFAAQMHIDLLIIGTSGRSMLKRALTGIQSAKALKVLTAISPAHSSVSRYIISHAPCPVILVPCKATVSPTHAARSPSVFAPVPVLQDQLMEPAHSSLSTVTATADHDTAAMDLDSDGAATVGGGQGTSRSATAGGSSQRGSGPGTPGAPSSAASSPRWRASNGNTASLSKGELLQLLESQEALLQQKEHEITLLRAQLSQLQPPAKP